MSGQRKEHAVGKSEAMLQDKLNDVDWDMFWSCADEISDFAEVVISFISMLADDIHIRLAPLASLCGASHFVPC